MHDVAVGDDVGFSFQPHSARVPRPGLSAACDIVLVTDGFSANETALEIRMDDRGSLRSPGPARDRPGGRLLGAGVQLPSSTNLQPFDGLDDVDRRLPELRPVAGGLAPRAGALGRLRRAHAGARADAEVSLRLDDVVDLGEAV